MANTHQTEPNPPPNPESALVREGWQQLQLQRPLAAWAAWQRALRAEPANAAAVQALEVLAKAPELPAAARAVYRFSTPDDPGRRARWDSQLRDRAQGLDDLGAAAEAFAALVTEDDRDADAWLNLALCRAWIGRNAGAVEALDRVVGIRSPDDPQQGAVAWSLAEVLRLGAGAEHLADDFRYTWVVPWPGGQGPPQGLFDHWPNLVRFDLPPDPLTGARPLDEGEVFEWLDRPAVGEDAGAVRAGDVPRVIATVISTPRQLRLSTPDPTGFAAHDELEFTSLVVALGWARREKAPLAIAWADAALGTFRYPAGLDDVGKAALAREVVEHYFENLWIHAPRQGLGGLSPIAASREAAKGDPVARVKLSAVVGFREQLGSRPTHAAIYQGYPFDRLRRRLGLLAAAEDVDDLSCASEAELDALDPSALDGHRLADAFASAEALRDDARTARFASELLNRGEPTLARLDPAAVFAPLVRESLRADVPEKAIEWLAFARKTMDGAHARTFAVWTAEVQARHGRPDDALASYRELLDRSDAAADAALALDAAETLLDNGHADQALPLLLEARDRARESGDGERLRKAERLLSLGEDS